MKRKIQLKFTFKINFLKKITHDNQSVSPSNCNLLKVIGRKYQLLLTILCLLVFIHSFNVIESSLQNVENFTIFYKFFLTKVCFFLLDYLNVQTDTDYFFLGRLIQKTLDRYFLTNLDFHLITSCF